MHSPGKLRLSLNAVLLFASFLAFAGCGSVSNNGSPSPTPTPTPLPSPSPTPSPNPSPSPSPTPGPASTITGRVTDINGSPINGTIVVGLEVPAGGSFKLFKQTNADAHGNFKFTNVPPFTHPNGEANNYALVVAARNTTGPGAPPGAAGAFFVPTILVSGQCCFGTEGDPIVPGTNVGTIHLGFTSQGDITGAITSTDASGTVPVPVHVTFGPMQTFVHDFFFDYPWPESAPSLNTAPGSTCAAGSACASFDLFPVPTDQFAFAIFSKAGYTFSPSGTPSNFVLVLNATSLVTGKPDCNPSTLTLQAGPPLAVDASTNAGTAAFKGCQ
jgi:hypothetical protein